MEEKEAWREMRITNKAQIFKTIIRPNRLQNRQPMLKYFVTSNLVVEDTIERPHVVDDLNQIVIWLRS